MEPKLFDMHMHLDLMADTEGMARDAAAHGLALFDCGVDPRDFAGAVERDKAFENILPGLGLHPWWLADGRCGEAEVDLLCKLAADARLIGEVGLDFSSRFKGTEELQTTAFDRLCQTLAENPLPHRMLSIHAVRAASNALDILERHGLLKTEPDSPAIIFHWFSGASDDLNRARTAGCYFSTNERMLKTKRGREYARQIPENQLLLETDYPASPEDPCTAADIEASLNRTLDQLATIRHISKVDLTAKVAITTKSLLAL